LQEFSEEYGNNGKVREYNMGLEKQESPNYTLEVIQGVIWLLFLPVSPSFFARN
jgi:hypothetical protein